MRFHRVRLGAAMFAALFLSLASCGGGGGGGGGSATAAAPKAAIRADLLVGFYTMTGADVTETSGYASAAWCHKDLLEALTCATQAKAQGMKAVLEMDLCHTPLGFSESSAQAYLDRFDAVHLLDVVAGIAWCDEPNTGRQGDWSDADVIVMSAAVRKVMARYPALNAKLSVIYACKGGYPGAGSFDAVGCDDYDSGTVVFDRYYPALEAAAPQAALIDIVAGSSPWKTGPEVMLNHGNGHAKAWIVLGFAFRTVVDGQTYSGIRDNGERIRWCEAFKNQRGTKVACT